MNTIKCICDNCNAILQIDKYREFIFCEYCGNKIFLDDTTEHIKYTNTADVERIRSEERIRMKEMDIEYEKSNKLDKDDIFIYVCMFIIFFIIILCFALAIMYPGK